MCHHHHKSAKTPLSSSQVGNLVLITVFNVFSRVLSIVFSLVSIMLFSSWKKDSLYPASRCRASMELSPHPKDIRVRLVVMSVFLQTPIPIVKDLLSYLICTTKDLLSYLCTKKKNFRRFSTERNRENQNIWLKRTMGVILYAWALERRNKKSSSSQKNFCSCYHTNSNDTISNKGSIFSLSLSEGPFNGQIQHFFLHPFPIFLFHLP